MSDIETRFKNIPANATIGDAPKEYLAAIGRVVVHWAHLEYRAHMLLQALLGLKNDTKSYWVVRPRAAKVLFDSILKIGKEKLTSDEYKELKGICKEIDKGKSKVGFLHDRNRVNHTVWWNPRGGRGSVPLTQRNDDELLEDLKPFPLQELKDLADAIQEKSIELTIFRGRVGHLASRQKRPPQ